MNNDEITYEQVIEYCRKRNYVLVDSEFYYGMEVCGIPLEEARRVIEVYKYTHKMPSKDYQEGFEDGVKYMTEHITSIIEEQFKSLIGERE